MRKRAKRVVQAGLLTIGTLLVLAGPAGATTVLGTERYKWFWWFAPLMAFMFLAAVIGLVVGYVRKVMLPRSRGRRSS